MKRSAPYLAGAVMLAVAMGVGRFAYTPLLTVMRGDAGLTTAAAGLLASVNLAGYLLGAALGMHPRSREFRRRLVAGSAVAVAILTAAMAVHPALWIAARFLTGAASGVAFVLTASLVLDHAARTGARRGVPLLFAGVGAGIVISGVLVALFTQIGGSRLAWAGLGVVSLAALVVAVPALPRDTRASRATATASTADARLFPALAFAYAIEGAAYIIPATFLVAMIRETSAVSRFAGAAWLLVGAIALPSVAIWSLIARRIGPAWGFAATLVVQAAGFAAPFVLPPAAGVAVLSSALGFTFIANSALATGLARAMYPARSNVVVGLLTVLYGIGQIAGPAIATLIALRTGRYDVAMLTAAVALAIAAAVYVAALLLRRRAARYAASPASRF